MDTLNTKAQSIVGGINEVNSHVGDISQLSTSEKTSLVTAVNEVKEEITAISDPYEINLTNLLSAEDSESISTAIGGIDNLNATVQDNRLIVGTISNGSVSVSIRILGNVTTLYYLLDSVLGLTLNEVAITNTSGTLSKSVTTHSVLTENMVINSLDSDETTLPLSAAQGKALDSKINNINVSADITEAINALDSSGQTASTGEVISSVSQVDGIVQVQKKTLTSNDIPELPQSKITDLDTALAAKADASALAAHTSNTSNPHSVTKEQVGLGNVDNTSDADKPISTATKTALDLKQNASDNSLNTTNKTIAGAINELKSLVDDVDVSGDVQAAISQLDFSEVTASTGNMIGTVSQTDGIINVSTRTITANDIPEITISKVTDLQTELDSKQDTLTAGTGIEITPENQINVTLDTTVFKVVSVLPDSPAQGDENKIHLVSAESTGANNAYTEYVWVNSAWEILGEYTSEVDLTPYLKTVDAESTYLKITDAESEYATKTELSTKQNSTDDTLETTSKNIVGAINEVHDELGTKQETLVSGTNIKTVDGTSLLGSGNISTYSPTRLDTSTLFADSATITSELSSRIASYGQDSATDFPLMYAGSTIGNIKPTWIRTNTGVTNFMCIADNKIWYFEIQGTTVQRASLAIS